MTKPDMINPAIALDALKEGNDYSPKLIGASIRSIATTGKKLDARIHAAACALLSRSDAHRDCSLVSSLINAMPKSARRKALIAWFHAFSNVLIQVNKDGTVKAIMRGPKAAGYIADVDHAAAFNRPFWTAEEADTKPEAFTTERFAAAVARLIKQAEGTTSALDDAGKAALAELKVVRAALPELAKA